MRQRGGSTQAGKFKSVPTTSRPEVERERHARGAYRVTFELLPLCHGDESDAITPRVALREQEIELEAHSPAGAAHPYRVTVHAAQGDRENTVEVWVTPAGEQEMMLRFYIDWIGERTVRFETSGLWFLRVTIPPADDPG